MKHCPTLLEIGEAGTYGDDDGLGGWQPLAVAHLGAESGVTELAWVHGNYLGVPLLRTDATGSAITAEPAYQAPGFPGQRRVLPDLYHNRHHSGALGTPEASVQTQLNGSVRYSPVVTH